MIRLKAPGRINLFGEHQDYLNFPIIAMAISKYVYLEAERISDSFFFIDLPDLNENLEIKLNQRELEYKSRRDYIRSGYNQFIRSGFKFQRGYKIKITGDIPINAGAASSSALVIVWLSFLNLISINKIKLDKFHLSLEGYNTEVKEFNEAGGMMDHFTSVYGNLIYLEPHQCNPKLINKKSKIDGFVLGNSNEKKETVEDLLKVKNDSIDAFKELKKIMPEFNQNESSLEQIRKFLPNLKKEFIKKIIGNIINRDITIQAKKLIFNNLVNKIDDNNISILSEELGTLLNKHHYQLSKNIEISTKKIEKMISNCIEVGALGAKINGSGFGGTMFALFPKNEDLLVKAIEEAGGDASIIKTSNGVESY